MHLVVDVLTGKNRRHVVYFGGVGLQIEDEGDQHKEDDHSSLELAVGRDILNRDLDLLGHSHVLDLSRVLGFSVLVMH